MDLSRAFDIAHRNLPLAELHAHGFGKQSLKIICGSLSNRKQRIKINTPFHFYKNYINQTSASDS